MKAWAWFSAFLLNALVRRVDRRIVDPLASGPPPIVRSQVYSDVGVASAALTLRSRVSGLNGFWIVTPSGATAP
jgi:hypothetical protein